uniref:SJCHGC07891 protein n=1 Tax=Schistosoma japonicum TaxID=6182 RepID=Q5DB41_SCHJA|nr:SJCHGC07891 protein [Schistosoma japonicum]
MYCTVLHCHVVISLGLSIIKKKVSYSTFNLCQKLIHRQIILNDTNYPINFSHFLSTFLIFSVNIHSYWIIFLYLFYCPLLSVFLYSVGGGGDIVFSLLIVSC